MKYELVSLSVKIGGKLFRKENKKDVIDDAKLHKADVEAAYKAGFIKPKGSKARTPAEVRKQYEVEKAEAAKNPGPSDADIKKADEVVKAAEEALEKANKAAKEAKSEPEKTEAADAVTVADKALKEAKAAREKLN